MYYLFIKIH